MWSLFLDLPPALIVQDVHSEEKKHVFEPIQKAWNAGKWRAFVAACIGEASSCCRCRRSLSVWVCLSLRWERSYQKGFLAFIKSVLVEFLVDKDPVYIQCYSPNHNVCLLELENKGGQCIPWLMKYLFSILKLTSVILKLFFRPRKTKKTFPDVAAVPAKG